MEGRGVVPEKAQGLDKEQWSAGGIEDFRLTGIIVVVGVVAYNQSWLE
jgi:alkyl hydroperoxide reductase subunit AhpF